MQCGLHPYGVAAGRPLGAREGRVRTDRLQFPKSWAAFTGGFFFRRDSRGEWEVSSDGGLLPLAEIERRRGFIEGFTRCFIDHRRGAWVIHPLKSMLAQRMHGLRQGARGDMVNRIKEQQLFLFADRTSSHLFRVSDGGAPSQLLSFSTPAPIFLLHSLGIDGRERHVGERGGPAQGRG